MWWTWTAPATGEATFNTQSSDFDTLLAIYTGTSVSQLTLVGSNDDASGALQSEVSFVAQQGQTYQIAVDGYGGVTGAIVFNWSQAGGPGGTCDPFVLCGLALTCVDGLEYPTTCGPRNCDLPRGPCVTEDPGPDPGAGGSTFASRASISGASGRATGSNVGAGKEFGEPNHAGNSGGASVWWTWTAPATGEATFNTQSSDFDTLLAIYTGTSVSQLTLVGSNDDASGALQSEVSFVAQQGQTYQIAVDGYGGVTGAIVLNWSQAGGPGGTCDPFVLCGLALTCVDGLEYPTTCGPRNCDLPRGPCVTEDPGPDPGAGGSTFASRASISGASGRATGSNVGAGKEFGEPNHAGNSGGASVWWTWTAPATGEATFNTQSSDFDTLLAIYTGTSVSQLTLVGSNDDASGALQSEVSFVAQQGQTYQIAVDGYGGVTGAIVFNWSQAGGSGGTCDPFVLCGLALTCVDGLEYPTTCGPRNCDLPRGPCVTVESERFISVSAGYWHTCGIRHTGNVVCWGTSDQDNGQLTPPAGTFISVSAGYWHTCGIRHTGNVECWGDDELGQSTPPAGTFTSISAGIWHTCGIRHTGNVECWGDDELGQSTPPAGTFTSISAWEVHTCGVRDTGNVECWGDDELGQSTPPAGTFTSVSAGTWYTCGVRDTGTVVCWGSNTSGQSTPPAGTFISVSAGAWHTCGLRETGAVECWGRNDDGRSTPPADMFASVSAGGGHACGVRDTGEVECWGNDQFGQSAAPVSTARRDVPFSAR